MALAYEPGSLTRNSHGPRRKHWWPQWNFKKWKLPAQLPALSDPFVLRLCVHCTSTGQLARSCLQMFLNRASVCRFKAVWVPPCQPESLARCGGPGQDQVEARACDVMAGAGAGRRCGSRAGRPTSAARWREWGESTKCTIYSQLKETAAPTCWRSQCSGNASGKYAQDYGFESCSYA